MKGSKSIKTVFILLCLSLTLSACNNAETTALDGSKPSVAGAIIIDPQILLSFFTPSPLYPLDPLLNEGETVITVEENDEADISFKVRANPSDTGTIVSYRFYPTDQITFVTDNGQNYLTIDFVYNPQTETYVNGFNINGAEDNNCVNNTYDLVAIEVESGNSQTFKVKVGDADKCIFIATNNGAGYAGNFAKKGIDNDGLGAVEVADAICNANIPTGINKDVTYKAMIAATNSPASIRYPGSNWVFSSFTSYYSQSGLKLAKTFTSGTTIGFANAETWTNSLGTSGKIWTGFSSIDWGIDTPSATQCAGIYNAQGAQASWYSSSATGTQGVLSAVNGQSIAEMTTTDPATVIETICSAKRYIACVGQ